MSNEGEMDTDGDETALSELLASADDFADMRLEADLESVDRTDDYALEQELDRAAKKAAERGDQKAQRAYKLLAIICTLHLRVEDPAEPWGPRWQSAEGRSYTASDFRGEQNSILSKVVKDIEHPALRARIADVVWYNDRSDHSAAAAAIEAYCAIIGGRLNRSLKDRFGGHGDRVFDLVDWFQRALQIAAMSQKRGNLPEAVTASFKTLYKHAYDANEYVGFERVARLGVNHGLTEWATVASDAEKLAERRAGGEYPMAVQAVWNLAAQGFGKLGNQEAKRRCQERSVDETLRMRDQVGSASAQAYWTRKAIGELRAARGFQERIAKLRAELRDLQDASLDEFGQFSTPIDLTEERQGTIDLFEGLTLPEAVLQFALLASSPKIEDLRQQALDSRKASFLSSLFGATYADHEGKTVAETPAASLSGDPDEDWFKNQSHQYFELWRHQIVAGYINPARQTIMTRFPIEDRHFEPIASMSPFVPPGHEHIFSLGFSRLFQGDFASSSYLLVPQLENSFRHVLLNANRETSKIKPDLLQEDRSLSGLLESLRPEMDEIFGEDVINEVEMLFHYRPGPRLRHEMAHGKMSAGECYHPTGIYACWIIYRLTCIPLVRYWKEHVASAIERAAF